MHPVADDLDPYESFMEEDGELYPVLCKVETKDDESDAGVYKAPYKLIFFPTPIILSLSAQQPQY